MGQLGQPGEWPWSKFPLQLPTEMLSALTPSLGCVEEWGLGGKGTI